MPKGTVLVVEGNPGVLIVARNVLGKRGHQVLCAGDPTEGLRKAQVDLPDLVIVDGTYATPEVLRALSDVSPIRIPLLISAPNGLGARLQASLPEVDGVEVMGVIEKPFTPDVLADTVHETLLDYHMTRPVRIDSARFKARLRAADSSPSLEVTAETIEPQAPTLLDPSAVRVSPLVDPAEHQAAGAGEALPVVPWVEVPDRLASLPADNDTCTETIQETLDAEAACDLIDVSVLGIEPPPVPEPTAIEPEPLCGPFERPESPAVMSGGFGVSAQARRLATRLERVTRDGPNAPDALAAACEAALRDEKLFGGFDCSFAAGEPLVAGRIGPVGVPQVLQLAEGFGRPVCARFEREVEAIEIVVLGRSIRFARQENLPEIFRLGRFLVEIGVLAGRNLSEAVEDARHERRRLGDFLCGEGVVRPEDVQLALSRQTKELVFELLAWDEGRFSVTASEELPEDVASAEVELGLTGLVLEGLRRRDEWSPTRDSSPPTPV